MTKRVLSAIVMLCLFVPLLIMGGNLFTALVCVLACASLYELLNIRDKKHQFPVIIRFLAYLAVVFIVLYNKDSIDFNYTIDYKFISALIFIFLLPIVFVNDNDSYNVGDSLFLIAVTLFLGFSFNLVSIIRNYDLSYFVYLLLIATMTDIFAYLSGNLVGRHKLCPKISPNKTWEGFIFGTFMGVFVASSFYHIVIHHNYSIVLLLFITTGLSIVGQLGDLVFSMIKRYYKTKDFSNLIPGHGGVLDRFDSIIFIALAFIFIMGII